MKDKVNVRLAEYFAQVKKHLKEKSNLNTFEMHTLVTKNTYLIEAMFKTNIEPYKTAVVLMQL